MLTKLLSLLVDKSRKEKMKVNIDITFPNLPCFIVNVDVMDVAGEHHNDVDHVTTMIISRIFSRLGWIKLETSSHRNKRQISIIYQKIIAK